MMSELMAPLKTIPLECHERDLLKGWNTELEDGFKWQAPTFMETDGP